MNPSNPSRIGDMSIGVCDHGLKCCPHTVTGNKIKGDPSVQIENSPASRLGDIGTHTCPHCGININIGNNPRVYYGDSVSHRLGDMVDEVFGVGNTISSAKTVVDG